MYTQLCVCRAHMPREVDLRVPVTFCDLAHRNLLRTGTFDRIKYHVPSTIVVGFSIMYLAHLRLKNRFQMHPYWAKFQNTAARTD